MYQDELVLYNAQQNTYLACMSGGKTDSVCHQEAIKDLKDGQGDLLGSGVGKTWKATVLETIEKNKNR